MYLFYFLSNIPRRSVETRIIFFIVSISSVSILRRSFSSSPSNALISEMSISLLRINEDMWSELFMLNKDMLISEIKAFEGELEKLRRSMETEDVDTMKKMMRISTERRAMFDKKLS